MDCPHYQYRGGDYYCDLCQNCVSEATVQITKIVILIKNMPKSEQDLHYASPVLYFHCTS